MSADEVAAVDAGCNMAWAITGFPHKGPGMQRTEFNAYMAVLGKLVHYRDDALKDPESCLHAFFNEIEEEIDDARRDEEEGKLYLRDPEAFYGVKDQFRL